MLLSNALRIGTCVLALSELLACAHAQPIPAPTPRPTVKATAVRAQASDTNGYAWQATALHPLRLQNGHGSLKAYATYPVADRNNGVSAATRFRVMYAGRVIVDKLLDTMPLKISIITVASGHHVAALDTYSGGAHCCYGTAIVDPALTGKATFTSHDWRDVGYKLLKANNGNGYVFRTGDDAMAYAFSSFSESTWPIKIFSYQAGKFIDVTDDYRSLLEADAAQHWHEYRTHTRSGVAPQSALVSYLADEYRLGNAPAAWARVKASYGIHRSFETKATTWLKQNGYESRATHSSPSS